MNFTFDGHKIVRHRGVRVLNHEELQNGDVSLEYVSRLMQRRYTDRPTIRKVLQTMWYQVNSGQEIWVVGTILEDKTVRGGTGWGAEFAKLCNKKLHVFDQEQKSWFWWNGDDWQAPDSKDGPRIMHPHFTGTGTRHAAGTGEESHRRPLHAIVPVTIRYNDPLHAVSRCTLARYGTCLCNSVMTKPLYVYVVAICLLAAVLVVRATGRQRSDAAADAEGQQRESRRGAGRRLQEEGRRLRQAAREGRRRQRRELKETDEARPRSRPPKSRWRSKIARRAPTAKRGDIFTPATEAMFRRLLRPPLTKGADAADNKAIIKDDAPQPKEVPFKVNGEYPKEAPLSTVPPDVLMALPPLPEDLQYRFVGKHLLLYDAKANLIIDYMLNAIP